MSTLRSSEAVFTFHLSNSRCKQSPMADEQFQTSSAFEFLIKDWRREYPSSYRSHNNNNITSNSDDNAVKNSIFLLSIMGLPRWC